MTTAISCIAPSLKLILEREARHIENSKEREAFIELLEEITDCPKGQLIGLDMPPGKCATADKPARAKRAPSEYNLFLKS